MKRLSQLFFQAFMVLYALVTVAAGGASALDTPPTETSGGINIWRDIAYVTKGHERQKLDFYAPARASAKPLPLVIYMHGGGWISGTKRETGAPGLCYTGYAVASIGYRLSTDAPFPAQIEDCKAAIRYLRANAARFNIDPDHIGASGLSAGSHLAALLGTTGDVKTFDKGENLDQSSRVQAVCDFFGPTNIAFYGTSRPDDILTRLFGGLIQDNPKKVQAANPIAYIKPGAPPFAIFHGDADPIVPLRHSQALKEALEKAKVPVTLTIVRGGGHGFDQKAMQPILVEVVAFFDKYLKKK